MVAERYDLPKGSLDLIKRHKYGNIEISIITLDGETSTEISEGNFRILLAYIYAKINEDKWDTDALNFISQGLTDRFGIDVELIPYLPERKSKEELMMFRTKYIDDVIISVSTLNSIFSDLLKFVGPLFVEGEEEETTNEIIRDMVGIRKEFRKE